MKKIFLSFADSRMKRASSRIENQAVEMKVYDYIITADENYLDLRFRDKFKDKLIKGSKGYGYWCWKPQIILQILEQLNYGDVLQYTDVGCHLNRNGIKRLAEYFLLADKSDSGILAFQANPPAFHDSRISLPDLSESKWCKGDLCDFFGVRYNSVVMKSQSIGAGVIFIKKCEKSIEIIKKWQKIVTDEFNLLDDSSSASINPSEFIEHRHDQSIFSILCKLNNVNTISSYEYWYPSRYLKFIPNWSILKDYPIHVKRDKGYIFYLKPYFLILRILNRIKLELKNK